MNSEQKTSLRPPELPSLPPLRKIEGTFKIIIPEDVERKIRHLCSRISDVEWSGTLFYEYSGSWEKEDLVITCKDIYVMDIGSAGYTEFDVNPGVVSYMCDHTELMDYQMGLIHSHNKMSTFFSGTDTATLREEGSKRNHFVSLIVNNAGKYTAGITRQVHSKRQVVANYSFGTFGGKQSNCVDKYEIEDTEIEWCELEIVKPDGYSFNEIDERLDEIKKDKEAKKTYAQGSSYSPKYTSGYNYPKYEPITSTATAYKAATEDIKRAEPHQLELFNDYLDKDKDKSVVVLPESLVHSCLLQLITGSIAIADESRINPARWALGMERVFDKRFEGKLEDFTLWAESFCEFLVFCPPKKHDKYDETEYAHALALALIRELNKLPTNKYIEIFKESLEIWMET